MSHISFSVIAKGLRESETAAARHATELVDEEYQQHQWVLETRANDMDLSVTTAEATAIAMRSRLQEHENMLGSLVLH